MGATPGKTSRTGREVIERMRKDGTVRTKFGVDEFQDSNGVWRPLSDADMSHKQGRSAVEWWNSTGRHTGAKSTEVRQFMLDSDNYYLEYYSINRSQGASLNLTYLNPTK